MNAAESLIVRDFGPSVSMAEECLRESNLKLHDPDSITEQHDIPKDIRSSYAIIVTEKVLLSVFAESDATENLSIQELVEHARSKLFDEADLKKVIAEEVVSYYKEIGLIADDIEPHMVSIQTMVRKQFARIITLLIPSKTTKAKVRCGARPRREFPTKASIDDAWEMKLSTAA